MLRQRADIGVRAARWIGQYRLVVFGKALQCLLLVQPQIQRHGQHPAGALVLLGTVVQRAIMEAAGLIVIVLLDKGQSIGKAVSGITDTGFAVVDGQLAGLPLQRSALRVMDTDSEKRRAWG